MMSSVSCGFVGENLRLAMDAQRWLHLRSDSTRAAPGGTPREALGMPIDQRFGCLRAA
jgi:hypothetical protein